MASLLMPLTCGGAAPPEKEVGTLLGAPALPPEYEKRPKSPAALPVLARFTPVTPPLPCGNAAACIG